MRERGRRGDEGMRVSGGGAEQLSKHRVQADISRCNACTPAPAPASFTRTTSKCGSERLASSATQQRLCRTPSGAGAARLPQQRSGGTGKKRKAATSPTCGHVVEGDG